MRVARAEGLRGEWRDRGHQAHADGEADKEHGVRQRRGRHGLGLMARSVVIIAIWPSWVIAIGAASFSVSESSIARWRPGTAAGAGGAAGARSILSSEVIAGDYHGREPKT